VSSKDLNVPKRSSHRRDLPGRVRDERASPAVAGAALEAEFSVPTMEEVGDGLIRPSHVALACAWMRTGFLWE
jgi:hypothetical protein